METRKMQIPCTASRYSLGLFSRLCWTFPTASATAASTIFWSDRFFIRWHLHHPRVPRVSFNPSRFNDSALPSIFPRNEPPNPAKYFSERPEMIPHHEEPKKATKEKET